MPALLQLPRHEVLVSIIRKVSPGRFTANPFLPLQEQMEL